ncbi:MAG: hypothetical protein QGI45_06290 [Myxococcota bacterium]|jgi:hypothetical protein|nr:hypothetical protein [Myxococcota bacterium]
MHEKKTSNIVNVIIAVILSAGILETLYLLFLIPEGIFYSGDGGLKALLTHQFSSGNFNANLVLSHDSWINALWNKGYFPFHEPYTYQIGHKFYMHYPIWFSLITAPFYHVFGYYGLYVVPLVSVWILWICFALLCKRYKLTTSAVCLALSALIFGSPFTLYGLQYWEHAPAIALAFMGFSGILLHFEERPAPRRIFLSGIFLGLSGLLRPELFCFCAVVLFVCLFVYCAPSSLDQKLEYVGCADCLVSSVFRCFK